MARLTPEQKQLARTDFEVGGMSQNAIAEKYGVGKATISRLANSEGWVAGKVEHLVVEKKKAIKVLNKVEQQMEHLNPAFHIAIDKRVYRELGQEGIFLQSAIENQYLANKELKKLFEKGDLKLSDLEAFARLTEKNDKVVNGNTPESVNIQQVGIEARPISDIFEQ